MGSYFAAFAPDCAYAAWVAIQKSAAAVAVSATQKYIILCQRERESEREGRKLK